MFVFHSWFHSLWMDAFPTFWVQLASQDWQPCWESGRRDMWPRVQIRPWWWAEQPVPAALWPARWVWTYKHTLLASFVFWNMLVIKHTDKIFVNTSRYNLWEWPVSCTWHMLSLWKALHVKLKVREIWRGENRWWWLLVASASKIDGIIYMYLLYVYMVACHPHTVLTGDFFFFLSSIRK